MLKIKETWYKIQYEEHEKKREDDTYSLARKMLLIPKARMRAIFVAYPDVYIIPLPHERPQLEVFPPVHRIEEEKAESPQSIGSLIGPASPPPSYDDPLSDLYCCSYVF